MDGGSDLEAVGLKTRFTLGAGEAVLAGGDLIPGLVPASDNRLIDPLATDEVAVFLGLILRPTLDILELLAGGILLCDVTDNLFAADDDAPVEEVVDGATEVRLPGVGATLGLGRTTAFALAFTGGLVGATDCLGVARGVGFGCSRTSNAEPSFMNIPCFSAQLK